MFAAESWGDERLEGKELLALRTKLGHAVFPHLVEQWALAYPALDASLLQSVARGLVCESCQKRKKAPRRPLVKPVRTSVAIFGSPGVCIYVPASRHWLISYSPIHLT